MPILYTDTEPKMHSVHGQDSIAHVIGTFLNPSNLCVQKMLYYFDITTSRALPMRHDKKIDNRRSSVKL